MRSNSTKQSRIPGVLLCLAIAVPSYALGGRFPTVGGPIFAILFGMLLGTFVLNENNKEQWEAGERFVSKKILQGAVVLLGFGLNLRQVAATGRQSIVVLLSTIATALIVSYVMTRLLKMNATIGTLVGVGSSICGGSAVAATAPVVDASGEQIAQSISVIFLFNVIAALIFPSLGNALGMSTEGFGVFAGTAVNDTSSVTAAASAWDSMHGTDLALATGTIVKLTRTLAIIPITLALAFWRTKKASSEEEGSRVSIRKIFPMFIVYFLLASLATTVLPLPGAFVQAMKFLSKFFIVLAMAAIGLQTNPVKLVRTGGKPILLGFVCWVSIASVSLLVQRSIGLW